MLASLERADVFTEEDKRALTSLLVKAVDIPEPAWSALNGRGDA